MTGDRSQRRLVVLALVALGLAGASIAVWLGVRDDGAGAQPASAGSSAPAPSSAPPPPALAEPGRGGSPVVGEIERGSGGTPERGRETVVDGVRVRDHRKQAGSGGSIVLPPNLRPPDGRRLSSESVAAINHKLLPVIRDCAADVPREERGDDARLEGEIVVNVKAGQVSVVQSVAQLRRVTGVSAERVKLCVEQRALGLTAQAATGEADVEGYSIQLNHALP